MNENQETVIASFLTIFIATFTLTACIVFTIISIRNFERLKKTLPQEEQIVQDIKNEFLLCSSDTVTILEINKVSEKIVHAKVNFYINGAYRNYAIKYEIKSARSVKWEWKITKYVRI